MEFSKYKDLLKQYIAFKSISTDEAFSAEVNATANWLYELFKNNSFEVDKVPGYGNDIVIAKYKISDEYKTVLIYGHYDVQPADIAEGWEYNPFEINEAGDKYIARGIVDNKGQNLIHIATVIDLISKKEIGYNIIFMIEGNEETGSPKLPLFIKDYANKLKCDYVFFSDGELTLDHPVMETGFRGVMNCTITITTSAKDNHSGLYGGSIPNAATVLSELISNMHDENNILRLSSLENNFEGISQEIIKNCENIPFSEESFKINTGAKTRFNKEMNFYIQNGYLSSAEVTSLTSGYQGIGYRNAVPGKAIAKINFRISPKHNVDLIKKELQKYMEENTPEYAEFNIDFNEAAEPILIDTNNEFAEKVKKIASKTFEKLCFYKICGAIVPIAGIFQDEFNVPVISLGLGNEDCNMHGANENYNIDLIKKGLDVSYTLFSRQNLN